MANQLMEREVMGDECAAESCPYEHHGGSKFCAYHLNGKGFCEDCGEQLMGNDIGYTRCKPCFDKEYENDDRYLQN